ncbi:MAG: hypothetical protein JWM22_1959 [Frankiales bacterium]|nr:hypothetical protein [Frankiales bacterium]
MRRPAYPVAIATGLLLLLVSGRYGYHRDELYFLQAGRHLDWGFPDQPPLTPLLARVMSWFAPHSLVLLRLPSTLSAAAVVLLSGLLAERLGARRSGQWLATIATAMCGFVLAVGHLLSTATTNLLGWVVISYLVVRLLQGADRRLWLLVGLVAGITFQANVLVAFLLLALAFGSAVVGPRTLGPWVAGVIAFVIGLPYLVWQGQHGWPQLDVARDIAGGGSVSSVPRALLVPFFPLQVGPFLLPLWVVGLRRILRDAQLRVLGVSFLLLAVVFVVTGGKPYYLGGLVPLLLAAGAQPVVDRTRRWVPAALLALSTPALLFTLPVVPATSSGWVLAVNPDAGETIGWPSFVRQVQAVVPRGDVVVTGNYGEAGALLRFGHERVYSGHNGFGLWAVPPGSTEALTVGVDQRVLARQCSRVVDVGRIHMPVDNDENGTALRTCTPRRPWAELWKDFRHLG